MWYMVNKTNLLLLFILSAFLLACNQSKKEANAPIDYISNDVPSSFLEFYEQFHADEGYQMDHIIFPLDGERQDTSTMKMVNIKWHKDSWIMHKEFNSYNETFKRSFKNLQGIIIEVIEDQTGQFSMERRFSIIGEEWNLIFYSEFKMKQ